MISGPFFIGSLVGVGCRMRLFGPRLGTLLGTLGDCSPSDLRRFRRGSRDRGVLPPPHGHLANALAVRERDRRRWPARRRSPTAAVHVAELSLRELLIW